MVLIATACSDSGISPNLSKNNKANKPHISSNFGLIKISINSDGHGNLTATAKPANLQTGPKNVASAISGPGDNSGTHGAAEGTIQIKPIAVESFNSSEFGSSTGKRYIFATFAVRNADLNHDAYTNPIKNLTFIAGHAKDNVGKTAVKQIQKFDGNSISNPVTFANNIRRAV